MLSLKAFCEKQVLTLVIDMSDVLLSRTAVRQSGVTTERPVLEHLIPPLFQPHFCRSGLIKCFFPASYASMLRSDALVRTRLPCLTALSDKPPHYIPAIWLSESSEDHALVRSSYDLGHDTAQALMRFGFSAPNTNVGFCSVFWCFVIRILPRCCHNQVIKLSQSLLS